MVRTVKLQWCCIIPNWHSYIYCSSLKPGLMGRQWPERYYTTLYTLLWFSRWFCHFDDDNYVNIKALQRLLSGFKQKEEVYLGKESVNQRIRLENGSSFSFATGGAGFCINRNVALRLKPVVGGLSQVCKTIRLPDDVTIGYLVNHVLGVKLQASDLFHSHLESLKMVQDIGNQVSLSYKDDNTVAIDSSVTDPTKFFSIHCQLYPNSCLWFYFMQYVTQIHPVIIMSEEEQ